MCYNCPPGPVPVEFITCSRCTELSLWCWEEKLFTCTIRLLITRSSPKRWRIEIGLWLDLATQFYNTMDNNFFLLNCWSSLLSRSFACLTYQSMITNLIWDVISRSSFTCKIMNGLQKISKSIVVVYELRNTSILYWYLNIDSGDKRWILRSLRNFGTNFDG